MDIFGKKLLGTLSLVAMAFLLAAGEAEERELGDNAFFADDYLTAVSHYRSARKLSEQNTLTEAWAQNTLRLGRAQLFAGDIAGARATLQEFRQRFSMRSAGTLPADLLAAEGKYHDAEKLYLAMEENGGDELKIAAKFGRAALLLRMNKLIPAEKLFSELAALPESVYAFPATRELAYTLIRQKKYAQAEKILAGLPEKHRGVTSDILSQLAQIRQGRTAEFKRIWRTLMDKQLRRPDGRSCELLATAAEIAVKQKENAFAVELLREADKFAPDANMRQDLLKRMINVQSTAAPEDAAKSAELYATLFPEQKDRFAILLNGAEILAKAKKFTSGIKMFQRIVRDGQAEKNLRYQAAVHGASLAEQGKNIQDAAWFYREAVKYAPDNKSVLECRCRYAEFLLRNHDYRSAVTELQSALLRVGKLDSDKLRFLLLEAAVRDNNDTVIAETAQKLLKSTQTLYRSRAHYELGQLARKRHDLTAARREYLAAAALKESGQYAIAGRFSAAMVAFRAGDVASAGKEALSLALEHPQFPQAAQALYLGYRAGRQINDEELKTRCARLLTEKYSMSEAYAVYALHNVADRAALHRDIAGAVAELEELEHKFSGKPEIVSESMLMRAELLRLSGKTKEALEVITALLKEFSGSDAAFFAAMKGGEITRSTQNYLSAQEFFQRAAELRKTGFEHDNAELAVVDVMLRLNDPKLNNIALAKCDKLIAGTRFPQIRISARYAKGTALEFAGKNSEALKCYEALLNDALLCRKKGTPYSKNICLRSAVAALQIVSISRKRSVYNRGRRIIANCRILNLETLGMDLNKLSHELEEKFYSQLERR